jgi:glycosyltransferase involved in cell wall biosynthesis
VTVVSFLGLPVLAANSPAKLYDALAVGTPVVVTNPGWTKTLVEQHGCGWYAPTGNAAALAERLRAVLGDTDALRVAGEHGRALARADFDRVALAARMRGILEKADK